MTQWPSIALAISVTLFAGCDRNEWNLPRTSSPQQQEAQPATAKMGNAFQTERREYLNTTRQELDQLRSEVDALKVKANNSGASLKADLDQKIKSFEEDLKSLEARWQQVKGAGESSWQEIKLSFSASIEKLRKSIHDATG